MLLMSIEFILKKNKRREMIMKKFRKFKTIIGELVFIIEEDNLDIGWYLYVYKNQKCIADYLQDTLEIAKKFAEEKYKVPFNSWLEELK